MTYNQALDILSLFFLAVGIFFMSVGALGIYRLPDFFNRMHAGSKCVTLGISGLVIAASLHLAGVHPNESLYLATTAVLVIIFQFIAAPVGAYLIGNAAHVDKAPMVKGTLDELAEDLRKKR